MDWSLYRTFLEISRNGSLSAAAKTLGLTHPTVRRHLDDLERELGGRLFTRSPRGLLATDLAHRILPDVTRIEAATATITRIAHTEQDQIRGTVRLSASHVMGLEVLPSMLAHCRVRHPGLRFELTLSDAETDILRRDADVAVRMTKPRQKSLIGRRAGSIPIGFYAHQDWIGSHGHPATLQEVLATTSLIGQDRRDSMRKILGLDQAQFRQGLVLATDSDVAQIAAVRAGMGVGIVQIPLAEHDPALMRLLPDLSYPLEVWLVTHPDLKSSPTIRAVMDDLHGLLDAYCRPQRPQSMQDPS